MTLHSGTRLAPHEILSTLGAGGRGEVYRARDTRLGRDVALEILPPDVSSDPARRARFEQEASATCCRDCAGTECVAPSSSAGHVIYLTACCT